MPQNTGERHLGPTWRSAVLHSPAQGTAAYTRAWQGQAQIPGLGELQLWLPQLLEGLVLLLESEDLLVLALGMQGGGWAHLPRCCVQCVCR